MKLKAALGPASYFKPAVHSLAKPGIGFPTSAGKDLQDFHS